MILLYISAFLIILILLFRLFLYFTTEFPLRKKECGFEYVYINEDGSVRELYEDEIEYLNQNFSPADSGRPYIKYRYFSKTADNKIWGFIPRKRVPKHIDIKRINKNTTN